MIKTRKTQLADGRTEIVRLLAADAMEDWSKDDPMAYEKSIIWLEDIDQLPFVRVAFAHGVKSRRGPLHATGVGRIVGYAKLTPDAPKDPSQNGYTRRFFYVKEADAMRETDWPQSAVKPQTVLPGAAGDAAE